MGGARIILRQGTLLVVALAGCNTEIDPCAALSNRTCLTLRVRGPNVDQIEVSGRSGARLIPDPARTPTVAADPFALPALIAIDLGDLAGAVTLRVRGLVAETEVGAAEASATLALHEHRRVEVTLLRAQDGGVPDGAVPLDGAVSLDGGAPLDGATSGDGGGGSWRQLNSGTAENLLGVWASRSDEVFIVGGSANTGIVLRGSDDTWEYTFLGDFILTGVWGSASNNVYAVSLESVAWRFDGSSWTTPNNYLGGGLHCITGTSETEVYLAGSQTISKLSAPRTNSWQAMFNGELGTANVFYGIFVTPSIIYVDGIRTPSVGSPAGAIRSSGTDWPVVDSPSQVVYALWGSSATDVYAVGGGGLIRHLSGGVWRDEPSPVAANLRGVWGSGPSDVTAVGDNGTILHRDASGVWQQEFVGTSQVLRAVFGVGGVTYVVGHGGMILRKR